MTLLFDQNLSPRLTERLSDLFPNAIHVSFVGLDRATDDVIWSYALANGHTIVTKDTDFADLTAVRGFPPKVVWLQLGNCTTEQIEAKLRAHRDAILALETNPDLGILILC